MEVNHTHTNHYNRNLRSYVYEFFMLFLAVTAGFFVENIRESSIERHREKDYMRSLVTDIKTDTVYISQVNEKLQLQIKGMDSLLKLLEAPHSLQFNSKLYHYSFGYLNSLALFTKSDRTIVQLRNSGGLRLIRRSDISDSIASYYGSIENVEYNNTFNLAQFNRILELEKELFSFKILRKKVSNVDEINFPLLNKDPAKLELFYNEVLIYAANLQGYISITNDLKKQASLLLKALTKEYKIK
jgi:hypothetical protein